MKTMIEATDGNGMKQEIKYKELILKIINSEKFKDHLEKINNSYSNLKTRRTYKKFNS